MSASLSTRLLACAGRARFWIGLLLIICVAAQPWHRGTGVLAFQIAVLLSCFVLFKNADLIKRLNEYRWLVASLTLIALVSVLSWVLREYKVVPFRSVKPYVTLLAVIPLFFAVRITGFSQRHISLVALVAGLSLGIYAVSELYSGTRGRWDAVENAVEFGNYAAIIGGLLLVLTTQLQPSRLRWLYVTVSLIGAFAALVVAYKTGTRSNLGIALLIAVCVTGYLVFFLKSWIAAVLMVVCIFGSAVVVKEAERFSSLKVELSRTIAGGYSSGSLGQRLELWRLSECIASVRPFLGVGVGSFKHAQLDDWPVVCDVSIRTSKGYFSQAHSVYFQTLATMGYVGLLSLLLFFLYLLSIAIKNVGIGGLPLLFLVGSFMVAGLTVDLFFKDFMVVRFVILISLGLAWLENYDSRRLEGIS